MNGTSATSASLTHCRSCSSKTRVRVADRRPGVVPGWRRSRAVTARFLRAVMQNARRHGGRRRSRRGCSRPLSPRSTSSRPRAAGRLVLIASATSRAAPRAEFAEPLRSRVATITGAELAAETVASQRVQPFTPRCSRNRRPAWRSRTVRRTVSSDVEVGRPVRSMATIGACRATPARNRAATASSCRTCPERGTPRRNVPMRRGRPHSD